VPTADVVVYLAGGQSQRDGTRVELLIHEHPLGQDSLQPFVRCIHLHNELMVTVRNLEAEVNRVLRVWKATPAAGVQLKETLEDMRALRGALMVL